MSEPAELEFAENMRHQRNEWRAEHAGWSLMALVLVAALSGVLGGSGLLDHTRTGREQSDLWVDHPRFARYQAPAEIRVHFRSPAGAESVRIALNRDFYEVVESELRPQPDQTLLSHDKVTFLFSVAADSQPKAITLRIKPTARWRREVHVWVDEASHLSFPIFIYP